MSEAGTNTRTLGMREDRGNDSGGQRHVMGS
jgi:hypothetical protein